MAWNVDVTYRIDNGPARIRTVKSRETDADLARERAGNLLQVSIQAREGIAGGRISIVCVGAAKAA